MKYTIYKFVNKINGKSYIGATKDFQARMKKYSSLKLGSNQLKNPINFAIAKYGFDSFILSVITTCTENEVDVLEPKYIQEEKLSNRNGCYNLDSGGIRVKFHSEQTKRKISEATSGNKNPMFGKTHLDSVKKLMRNQKIEKPVKFWKGKHLPSNMREKISQSLLGNIPSNRISVIQMDMNNKPIKEFDSITHAANELSLDGSSIGKCCKGKFSQVGGFKWKRQESI